MGERKTEFWWASIDGADPEPVERTKVDGRPAVYTCGCADPFYLDEPDCPVRFLTHDHRDSIAEGWVYRFAKEGISDDRGMKRPKHPDKLEEERAAIFEGNKPKNKGPKAHPQRYSHTTTSSANRVHGWRGAR